VNCGISLNYAIELNMINYFQSMSHIRFSSSMSVIQFSFRGVSITLHAAFWNADLLVHSDTMFPHFDIDQQNNTASVIDFSTQPQEIILLHPPILNNQVCCSIFAIQCGDVIEVDFRHKEVHLHPVHLIIEPLLFQIAKHQPHLVFLLHDAFVSIYEYCTAFISPSANIYPFHYSRGLNLVTQEFAAFEDLSPEILRCIMQNCIVNLEFHRPVDITELIMLPFVREIKSPNVTEFPDSFVTMTKANRWLYVDFEEKKISVFPILEIPLAATVLFIAEPIFDGVLQTIIESHTSIVTIGMVQFCGDFSQDLTTSILHHPTLQRISTSNQLHDRIFEDILSKRFQLQAEKDKLNQETSCVFSQLY
jgi:hypothetical protein